MRIKISHGSVKVIPKSIRLDAFPTLRKDHFEADLKRRVELRTATVERLGRAYVKNDFPVERTAEFVRSVCSWGNRAGTAELVITSNDLSDVSQKLRKGHARLLRGNYAEAIEAVTSIKGLGISFGSKHLRMMAPSRAVVLDSVISERLGYPREVDSYIEFLKDCIFIKEKLLERRIYPFPNRQTWRVSEVEMAIYMSL